MHRGLGCRDRRFADSFVSTFAPSTTVRVSAREASLNAQTTALELLIGQGLGNYLPSLPAVAPGSQDLEGHRGGLDKHRSCNRYSPLVWEVRFHGTIVHPSQRRKKEKGKRTSLEHDGTFGTDDPNFGTEQVQRDTDSKKNVLLNLVDISLLPCPPLFFRPIGSHFHLGVINPECGACGYTHPPELRSIMVITIAESTRGNDRSVRRH